MLRVALLGAGNHCRNNHAPALRHFMAEHAGAVELAAVCDLDAAKGERFREAFGFRRAFSDIDAMLDAAELDAIVAVMPIPAILPVARQLFARGLPVLMEKPLGQDMAEARAIVAAAGATGCPVMVSMNRRYDPAVLRARDWMSGLGPLRAIHGVQLRHRRVEAPFLWGTAIHVLDLMVHLAGPLRLRAGSAAAAPFEAGVSRMAVLDGGDGIVGSVHILPCCGRVSIRSRFGNRLMNSGEPAQRDDGSDTGSCSYPYPTVLGGIPGRIPGYRLLPPLHTGGCQATRMRTDSGLIWYSVSSDEGETWRKAEPLRHRDGGEPLKNPVSPCPVFALERGDYVLLFNNNNGRGKGLKGPEDRAARRPAYLARGRFRPTAHQPIWFSKPKLFIDNDAVRWGPPGRERLEAATYVSLTEHAGRRVLWYPDRKSFLLGKLIPDSLLDAMKVPETEGKRRPTGKETGAPQIGPN